MSDLKFEITMLIKGESEDEQQKRKIHAHTDKKAWV